MALKRLRIQHETLGWVAGPVLWARTPWHRFWGLMGTRRLPAGQGLLLERTNAVHGFFMRYPLHLVFLSRQHQVLKIAWLKPWGICMARGAYWVLELSPDTAMIGLQTGDRVTWEEWAP
ncbi:MAG: DUF192 domain-containing protein [Firmicutes bacterium]|nr:DUF192 domain-containing protein [Bacillota bacterium]